MKSSAIFRKGVGLIALGTLTMALTRCGGRGDTLTAGQAPLQVFAISSEATPEPVAAVPTTIERVQATPVPPEPTPTPGPIMLTLDFTSYRHDVVTLRVGQALKLDLMQGPTSDWLSGVDDATVLRPMAPDGSGIYQAMMPGTALLTAHLLYGCAKTAPSVPCKTPEDGLWFQMRVYVLA